jgi:hypothetical protein
MRDVGRLARVLVLVVLGILVPASARAVDVTACGQVVPANQIGVLQVDLTTCPSSAVGVFLQDRATLDLNGHTIASGAVGVRCMDRRCTVHGPGDIHGTGLDGILAQHDNARVHVLDVQVHDNSSGGVVADGAKPRIDLTRVQLHGNVVGAEVGYRGRIFGEDVDASNNHGNGIVAAARYRFERLTLIGTTAGPSGGDGLVCQFGTGVIIDSTVIGSAGADLATFKKPKLVRSTCGTSRHVAPGGATWGVCAAE